ncbi:MULTISPECIES: NAD(P)/FAD-dependent oxidoreductase [unclassified Pseudonocardia]|uniref:flavin-containing monooxygenase n=1 Tax=unclassified Pseudonocardia TaxID=2619320 RepID=UPI00094B4FC2|nr:MULTISPECIES: NAD(P)-binding domain-containing protein [unclassified Pseudonocardia]
MNDGVREEWTGDPGRSDVDVDRLRQALAGGNIPTLLMVLAHVTGDDSWLEGDFRPQRPKGLDDNDSGGLPDAVQAQIREAVLDLVVSGAEPASDPAPERVARMLEVAMGEDVPSEYGPLLSEELGIRSRDVRIDSGRRDVDVLIIGSGLSGLCMAVKLEEAGVPYTILEKNDEVGGTWLENTYPGCGVDTPSHLYSFSFFPNTRWDRYFAKRPQVSAYLERLTDAHGVRRNIEFGVEVENAEFDSTSDTWRVSTVDSDGIRATRSSRVLISAVGMVNRPSVPHLPGLDSFEGPTMHTAEWRSDVDLAGKRVAVVGTGASAMQLVPSVAEDTERITVFQRSKQWALPHPNYHRAVSEDVKHLMEVVPYYAAWYRLRAFWNFSDRLHPSLQIDPDWPHPERSINAVNDRHRVFLTEYIRSELGEQADELLDACLPDYPPYGKRPLLDNGWYRTIRRDDVELVTEGVAEIRSGSVVSDSGEEHPADVLVLATGFKTLQFLWPMEIRGRSGQTMRDMWGKQDARAYLGITVPDFPNFFILNGPNTNAGHGGSAIIATEFQVRYVMQMIGAMISDGLATTEVRKDVFDEYNRELDEALSHSIWVHPGMTTYYRNDAGRVVISSPWKYLDYWQRTLQADLGDYHVESGADVDRATA